MKSKLKPKCKLGGLRFSVYTRFCRRCHKYFKTESRARGKRVCPNCKLRKGWLPRLTLLERKSLSNKKEIYVRI